MTDKILSVKGLKVSFRTEKGTLYALRGVDLDLYKDETLAIVGESGSGKSVTVKTVLGLTAPNATVTDGEITCFGTDLLNIKEKDFRTLRGRRLALIPQDAMSSLDPIVRMGKQITETIIIKGNERRNEARRLLDDLLTRYGIGKQDIREYTKKRFAHECASLSLELLREILNQITGGSGGELTEELDSLKYLCAVPSRQISDNGKGRGFVSLLAKLRKTRLKAQIMGDYSTLIALLKEIERTLLDIQKPSQLEDIPKKDADALYLAYKKLPNGFAKYKAIKLMKEVGIDHPYRRFRQYPFELSGGMCQRVVIAIALSSDPELLICDEPTTSLDVTVQAQVLELIADIKKSRSLSVIFITHDLGVVAKIADRVAVMYAGKVVEVGTVDEIFYSPAHPYTWGLLGSASVRENSTSFEGIPGNPPDLHQPPRGDAFAERNKYALEIDFKREPPMFRITETHYAATWLLHPRAPKVEWRKNASTDSVRSAKESEQ